MKNYLSSQEKDIIEKAEKEIFNNLWAKGLSIGMIEKIGKKLSCISSLPYEKLMQKIKFS